MKSPIFGPSYQARSGNIAYNELVNLYIEPIEAKGAGKEVGALYGTPGLQLECTCGTGPVRWMQQMGNTLWVVSGTTVYSVDQNFNVTSVGTIPGTGTVNMMNNGYQMAIFTATNAYIVPGGVPLNGGTISSGGSQYVVDDTIQLTQSGGTQTATAIITVTGVSSGVVTAFNVTTPGAFGVGSEPTSFTQNTTSGSGAGFTLTSPTYGINQPVYEIMLPYTPSGTGLIDCDEQDGFGLINQPGTYTIWQSNENDFSIWNALYFASASGDSDNVVGITQNKLEMFITKEYETEVWYNAGTPGFIFQRLAGVYMEVGCVANPTVIRVGETLMWLGQNLQGHAIVVQLKGYEPIRVSTHALEHTISEYSTISDAFAYSYQFMGHIFYVLTFPTANATWVYDMTASQQLGFSCWHQLAALSNGMLNRHWGNCGTFFNNLNLIGDYLTGNIYSYQPHVYQDNGNPIKRIRSWRAMPQSKMEPQRFSSLQLDNQTGTVDTPPGTDPVWTLRWSDDGAHNWSNEKYALGGAVGQTAQRVKWNRLGSTRRNSGLDRIFEVSTSDNFRVAIIGAEIW